MFCQIHLRATFFRLPNAPSLRRVESEQGALQWPAVHSAWRVLVALLGCVLGLVSPGPSVAQQAARPLA